MRQSSFEQQMPLNIAVVGDLSRKINYHLQVLKIRNISYKNDSVGNNNLPQKLDNTNNNQNVELNIIDTIKVYQQVNQDETLPIRPDIYLFIFSVVDNYTFNNVISKWIPLLDIKDENNRTPSFLLIGNKIDLRQDKNSNHLTRDQKVDKRLKKNYLNLRYLECSAVTQNGLKEIFLTAIKFVFDRRNYQKQISEVKMQNTNQIYCCQLVEIFMLIQIFFQLLKIAKSIQIKYLSISFFSQNQQFSLMYDVLNIVSIKANIQFSLIKTIIRDKLQNQFMNYYFRIFNEQDNLYLFSYNLMNSQTQLFILNYFVAVISGQL